MQSDVWLRGSYGGVLVSSPAKTKGKDVVYNIYDALFPSSLIGNLRNVREVNLPTEGSGGGTFLVKVREPNRMEMNWGVCDTVVDFGHYGSVPVHRIEELLVKLPASSPWWRRPIAGLFGATIAALLFAILGGQSANHWLEGALATVYPFSVIALMVMLMSAVALGYVGRVKEARRAKQRFWVFYLFLLLALPPVITGGATVGVLTLGFNPYVAGAVCGGGLVIVTAGIAAYKERR